MPAWFNSLSSDHQFEILKIIIDKGLLALVAILATICGAVIIESYKTRLQVRADTSKKFREALPGLLNRVDQFEESILVQVNLMRQKRESARNWINEIASEVNRLDSEFFYNALKSDDFFRRSINGRQSLAEVAIQKSPSQEFASMVENINWEEHKMFIKALASVSGVPSDSSAQLTALYQFCITLLPHLCHEEMNRVRVYANRFMEDLVFISPDNKKEELKNINFILQNLIKNLHLSHVEIMGGDTFEDFLQYVRQPLKTQISQLAFTV